MAKKDKKDFTSSMGAFFSDGDLEETAQGKEEEVVEWKRTTIIINPQQWEDIKALALYGHEDAQVLLSGLMARRIEEAEGDETMEKAREVYRKKMEKKGRK